MPIEFSIIGRKRTLPPVELEKSAISPYFGKEFWMTRLLLNLFVPGWEQKKDAAVRAGMGSLSGIVGIVCNLLLFTGKLLVGTLAGSVSVTADAMNNLSDASSSIVTLLGFRLGRMPADEEHPYGHARFEYLSGLGVAVMIIVIGFELAKSSLSAIFSPVVVEFSPLTAGVLTASLLLKLWLAGFYRKVGKLIDSQTVLAASADSRNDCVATAAVLVAGLLEKLWNIRVDGFMGLAVALFILWSGWNLAKETVSPLLGENAGPELRELILDYVSAQPKVLGCHDLMVHDYGPGQRFASLHVEMDMREDPLYCHELIDDMERECLRNHNIHLVIHYDPVVTDDPELNARKAQVADLLKQFDPRLTLHDFRMVKGFSLTNLVFDVSLPLELRGREQEIRRWVEEQLNENSRVRYFAVITFDT